MKCTCKNVLQTMGQTGCRKLLGSVKGILLSYNGTGGFAKDPMLPESIFSYTPYLVKTLRNSSVEVSEPVFQEFEDGYREYVRDGSITFSAVIPRGTFQYICNLRQLLCFSEIYGFLVDKDGNILTGKRSNRAEGLYEYIYAPLKLSSFVASPQFSTDNAVQGVSVTFRLETPVCDLHVITPEQNILEADPLIPLELLYIPSLLAGGFFLRPAFDGVFGDLFTSYAVGASLPSLPFLLRVYLNGTDITSSVTFGAYNATLDARAFNLGTVSAGDVIQVVSGVGLYQMGYFVEKSFTI